ncbi:MAG: hypothetical protein ACAH83_15280 [Alphaproteobacteria bacterium]
MSFKSTLGTIALGGAVALGAFGVGAGVIAFNDAAHPQSQGQEYLAKKGYTNISGGATSWFNGCGKNVYARSYNVTNPSSGNAEQRTVCFTLFGPSSPWIGK